MKGVKMPKVLRIEWARVFGQWMGRVVEQSHRGDEFAVGCSAYKSTNGIILKSRKMPEWIGDLLALFVRGWGEDFDNRPFGPVSDEDKTRIDEAVAAYNREFGEPGTAPNGDSDRYPRVDGSLKLDDETQAIFNKAADRICPDPLKLNRFNDERIVVDLPAIADAVSGIIARRLRG